MSTITTLEQLEAIYGQPSGGAVMKELPKLNEAYRGLIEASPFVVIATAGEDLLDCSPKGDAPGFVRVIDEVTLALPDRLGNNRIDNLRNLIVDPRISLLFLIPGSGETLRVNGRATISIDPDLLDSFKVKGKAPRSVIVTTIESVYFHCPKAFIRSKLWDPATWPDRSEYPTYGDLVQCLVGDIDDIEDYNKKAAVRIAETLY